MSIQRLHSFLIHSFLSRRFRFNLTQIHNLPSVLQCSLPLNSLFVYVSIAFVSLPYLVFAHPSFFCHLHVCVFVCLPDNLSEVLLRLMKGDCIRLQIPLINLVSSTSLLNANELLKCIATPVSGRQKKSV